MLSPMILGPSNSNSTPTISYTAIPNTAILLQIQKKIVEGDEEVEGAWHVIVGHLITIILVISHLKMSKSAFWENSSLKISSHS